MKHYRVCLDAGVAVELVVGVSVGEQALALACHMTAWATERCALLPPTPVANRNASLRVMRAGDLSRSLTNCNTGENRPCVLRGQQHRAGSVSVGTGELSQRQ